MEQKQHRYRRLKWRNFQCVPAKSGDIIGEVCFTDRWGNEYHWAPDWDSVSFLILEALATEVTNNPDGPWAQVFKDLVVLVGLRVKAGEEHPRSPELVEELLNKIFLGTYLDSEYRKENPEAQIFKEVKLGPVEWDFLRCPECNGAVKFIGLTKVQETVCGLFKCRECGHKFISESKKEV
jgi:hypothetical protein